MWMRTTLLALLPLIAGCWYDDDHHHHQDEEFLEEDVIDLMTVIFQGAENAFVGDNVFAEDVIQPAGPGNQFTAIYELPPQDRRNLGFGFGEVELQIREDGVVHPNPLAFSFATTSADIVDIEYRLLYNGEARATNRGTDVDLLISVRAQRTPTGFDFVDYLIDGFVDIGQTFCDAVVGFIAFGRPRDGIEVGTGDGTGEIDDPDVFDVFDFDLDFFDEEFRAEGDVGDCCFFEELFDYREVW